jgi:hypothetical protein
MNPQLLPATASDESSGWRQTVMAFLAEKERRSGSRRTVEGYARMLWPFLGGFGSPAEADELGLARIAKEREEAGRKLALTRDIVAWQATMTRLDAAEALARQPLDAPRLTPLEIVDYLRSLAALWTDSGPDGRRVITSAIFARTDVMSFRRLEYELTPDAIELGLDAALPSVMELKAKVAGFGRGERI